MLRLRVLTTVIGLPLVVASILLGHSLFMLFLAVVAAACTIELCRLVPGIPRRDPLALVAIGWAVLLAVRSVFPQSEVYAALISAPLVITLLLLLTPWETRRTFTEWAWTVGGALYVGWLFGHWGLLYALEDGLSLVMFGMLTTFAYDTGAYFAGRAFGQHKMAPKISAGKTWEGGVGGLLVAVGCAIAIRAIAIGITGGFPFSLGATILAGVLVPVAAQLGDLVESALKRSADVKDAGSLLPGHGGMLDRFDSLLFTGTMLYFYTLWIAF
ncbi:phosphatidate cytidylyltransferase [Chloroflexota bacterium]